MYSVKLWFKKILKKCKQKKKWKDTYLIMVACGQWNEFEAYKAGLSSYIYFTSVVGILFYKIVFLYYFVLFEKYPMKLFL